MKILSVNTGYFLGYNGKLSDYMRKPFRSIIGHRPSEKTATERFVELVEDVQPDAVLLQETDSGSIRTSTRSQSENLVEELKTGFRSHSNTKYSGKILGNSPFFRNMSNAILYKNGTVNDHYLSSGTKSLMQELKFEEFSIFSVHLSRLSSRSRRKQVEEIAEIVKNRGNYLLSGDFNFHKGEKELRYLRETLDGKVISPGKTFPASDPSKTLDLSVGSPDIDFTCKSLDHEFSDHKPLVIDIKNY